MTLTTAVAGVAAYLAPVDVEYLSTIYPHPPKVTAEQQWFEASVQFPSMTGSGAVIYIDIENRRQKRIAFGGAHNGRKFAVNDVTLLCYFRSALDRAEDAGAVNFAFLDSVETRILADRTMAGAFFQAGEGGETGGDDIQIAPGMPVTLNGGIVQCFSTVKFQACEILDS